MALGKLLKGTTKSHGKRRGHITRRASGRNKGRYCVVVDVGKRTPGFKGRGSTVRFHGCFKSKTAAERRLASVVARGGTRKRRRARRKK